MAAAFLGVEELELEKDEAARLGDAVKEVGKQYALAFDPKKVAVLNLCSVAGMIYGTRFMAWRLRQKRHPPAEVPRPSAPSGSAPPAPTAAPLKDAKIKNPSDLWPQSGELYESAIF